MMMAENKSKNEESMNTAIDTLNQIATNPSTQKILEKLFRI